MRALILILIGACSSLYAQQAEPVLFSEKIYDFGDIAESGGHADHDFTFTNNTGRTLRIISVQPSCGCTTPEWTREPVQPGKVGHIKASFDPRGRPGYFNKSLTVTTDFDNNPLMLQIKGQVVAKKEALTANDFPAQFGNLRMKYSSMNLGKIFINKLSAPKEFRIFNAGENPITFSGKVVGPPYVRVETPKVLAPNESGVLKLTYDAKLRNQYGFVSDNVEIMTDDSKEPMKSISVYATIEEFFPALSPTDLANAPVLRIDINELDMGRIRQGNVIEREIAVTNLGKKELQIRAIQANCSCVSSLIVPDKIQPGGQGKLTISFNSQDRAGLQTKAVTLYSNDPRNPVQRITLSGYIDNP